MHRIRMGRILGLGAILVLAWPSSASAGGGGHCPSDPPAAQPGEVLILDNCFSPGEVSIETGETVNWAMQGRLDHTVTFADLSSGDVDGTFSARFNQPGTYAYQCVYHPGMLGTIEVTGDPADGDPIEPLSELRGLDGFPPAPPEPFQVSLAAQDVGEPQRIELTLSSEAWVAIALAALGITLFSSVIASIATRLIRR